MTTYILHGGRTSQEDARNDMFFDQFAKLVNKNSATILLCYFSRNRDEWDALTKKDGDRIRQNTTKEINILIAENPADLLQKMDQSDVLYVAGGDAENIEPMYKDLVDLKQKLDGKIYAGSSMGAFLPSEQYILSFDDQDAEIVHKGLGLLPIQTLCHWDIEKEKEKKLKLLNESSDSPILVLNEFEYVVLYK